MLRCKFINRPTAYEIYDILYKWENEIKDNKGNPNEQNELIKQIKEADEINMNSPIPSISLSLSYETHSEAIYTSRLLSFNNLPEPKNSDDYYYEKMTI